MFHAACFAGEGPSGRPFVYIQMPKAACSSIKEALMPAFGVEWREGARTVHSSLKRSGVRVPKAQLGDERFADHYKFSFVRNPFDRLVSTYFSKVAGHRTMRLKNPEFDPAMSFSEFAETVCEIPEREADPHFRSQWTFLDGLGLDFVGRMERMGEDWARVAGVIGVPPELPHSNRSADRLGYRSYYDGAHARKVAERFRHDLEAFGYSF